MNEIYTNTDTLVQICFNVYTTFGCVNICDFMSIFAFKRKYLYNLIHMHKQSVYFQ